MNVTWTRVAQGHLRAIHNYIAADSPRHAQRVVDRITRRTEMLKSMPCLGAEVPEYADESIREVLFRSYRIIYRILPDRIDVLAVIHGAQLLPDTPP
jgi:plasmid stabilization system protein ParE